MAAGSPIVSTDVGGTKMLVGPEGEHLLGTPGDRKGLAGKILQLAGDGTSCHVLGEIMFRRAVEHFSIDSVARRYLDAYRLLFHHKEHEMWSCSQLFED
jgi:glycosyltransferase involved in cell wall biosynthesis